MQASTAATGDRITGGNNIPPIEQALANDVQPRERLQLICRRNEKGMNPLHEAAELEDKDISEKLVDAYKCACNDLEQSQEGTVQPCQHPWSAINNKKEMPLHIAIKEKRKEVAIYLLSVDPNETASCDEDGCSPLYLAVKNGWEDLVLQMLDSYKFRFHHKFKNPLNVVPKCSVDICRRLLERRFHLKEYENELEPTYLRHWIQGNHIEFLHFFLVDDGPPKPWSQDRRKAISTANKSNQQNALHDAVDWDNVEAATLLISAWLSNNDHNQIRPWLQKNYNEEIPLLMAFKYADEEDMALALLNNPAGSTDPLEQCKTASIQGSPLFLSIQKQWSKVADTILPLYKRAKLLGEDSHTCMGKQNPLHVAFKCPEIARQLIRARPDWIKQKDGDCCTPLDKAAEADDIELINLLISQTDWTEYAPKAWIKPCERGNLEALRLFMSNQHGTSSNFWKYCDDKKDTPLHHIKFDDGNDYENLFKIPGIEQRKDKKNSEGKTPLHVAIGNENLFLVEVLLTHNANLKIGDKVDSNDGITAIDQLAEKCKSTTEKPEWDSMCKRNKVFPKLKLKNILPKTNLDEMRSTMSVIAALLATITFAAGFQIPGGLNNNTGYTTLGKKAAFIVFSLSDTFAMCCSMLALFNLIWTMGLNEEESILLMDRTVNILQFSLVGTLLAFMTGVFVVVAHQTLWVAIVIIVFCSVLPLICNKTILRNLFLKRPHENLRTRS